MSEQGLILNNSKDENSNKNTSLSKDIQGTLERLDANHKNLRSVEEAKDLSHRIHHDQKIILDELADCWKGPQACRLIGEAFDANEADFSQAKKALDEKQEDLLRERKTLCAEEEELHNRRAHLTQSHLAQDPPAQAQLTKDHLTKDHPAKDPPAQNHPAQNHPAQKNDESRRSTWD